MSGALEGHRLEDDEPLRVPAALPDSRKFRGQRLDKAAPDPPARLVVPPSGHHCERSPSGLLFLVGLDLPTEVRSIVGVHQVSLDLLGPPILPRGYVPRQIPCGPLPVLHLLWRPLHHRRRRYRHCRHYGRLPLCFSRGLRRWRRRPPHLCHQPFPPRRFPTPPSPSSVVWSSTSESGYRTLVHPRHRQSLQCFPAFRQAHRWVLQSDIVLHFQQATVGNLPELSGGGVPPVSVSSSSPVPSSRASERAAVDGAGSI